MGHEAPYLTPKGIAKRLKAKGLGKQWLYCQMCRKQCRDQNGFKCHCESEQHIRNMELFAEKGEEIVEEYSRKFEEKFMEYMRQCYRSQLVSANVVYNQIIRERNHVRMNGTKWAELSEFVEHLVKTGKCKLEETDKGLKLRYIEDNDMDSEIRFKHGMKRKRASGEVADIDRHEKEILMQIERAKRVEEERHQEHQEDHSGDEEPSPNGEESGLLNNQQASSSNQQPQSQQEEVKVAFAFAKKKNTNNVLPPLPGAAIFSEGSKQAAKDDGWVCEGTVVKVMSKKVGNGAYYKRKGVVKRVLDGLRSEIEMLDTSDTIKVDQAELETVIPQIGRTVRVVNGQYRGCDAKLVSCDMDKYSVTIQIHQDGTTVSEVPYEDVCKVSG